MLTESKCIEVAEKVWGWKLLQSHPAGATPEEFDEPEWHERDHRGRWQRIVEAGVSIEKQVNSWQGFGRTVEAMGKKGYFYGPTWSRLAFFQKDNSFINTPSINIHFISDENYSTPQGKDLIKATHLSALEVKM